jgi:NhaP-type Na+/H+ or K+/H+ antiporter
MSITNAYVLGYNLSCISPSIMVPGVMSLNERGYGRSKGIASTVIAAGTFDDIICIICFGICETISLSFGGFSEGSSLGLDIGLLFVANIVGLIIGVVFGLGGWFFKFIKNPRIRMNMKLAYCVFGAISFVIIEEYAMSHDAKYICGLFFGYTLFRVWGDEKPAKEIAWFWFFV